MVTCFQLIRDFVVLAGELRLAWRLIFAAVMLALLQGSAVGLLFASGMHAGKGSWERFVAVEMIASAVLAMWLFIGSLLSSHKLTWLPELLLTEPVSQYLISRIPCVQSETAENIRHTRGPSSFRSRAGLI